MNVNLFTVGHVLEGFVERNESGIWNPESGMRNSQPFQMSPIVYFYTFFSRSPIRIIIIISTRTLQDIEQNVLEALADQGVKKPLIELFAAIQTCLWLLYK